MPTVVYIEPLPKGREDAIMSYAVEDHAGHVLQSAATQEAAIKWAKDQGHSVHVARVRETDKGNPDHWRKA
jgi:hypothetical protein